MKKWIITAVAMVIIGSIISIAAAAIMHFDLSKLDGRQFETNTYTVDKSFRSISVTASTEKLFFKPAEDGNCSVVCCEETNRKHEVVVINGTLTIQCNQDHTISGHSGFSAQTPEITVYLPEHMYSDLLIETDTGDILIPADFSFNRIAIKGDTSDVTCLASTVNGMEIAASTGDIALTSVKAGWVDLKTTTGGIRMESVKCNGDVNIHTSTGKVKLQDITCRNLTSEGTTGDLTLEHVIAADAFSITRSTGDVTFIKSDASSIFVQTDTGDVTGSLVTEKAFITETDTGKVKVPDSIKGGRCEIRTDTGNIILEIP